MEMLILTIEYISIKFWVLYCIVYITSQTKKTSSLKLWSFTQNTVWTERSCYINAVIYTDKNPNENNKITFVKQKCVLLRKRTYQRLERDCIQLFSQNLMVMVCQSTTLSLLKWLQHLWSLNQDNQIDSLNIESRQSDWFLEATTCCIQRWWRWWWFTNCLESKINERCFRPPSPV